MDLKQAIRAYALKNALQFGKASEGAVISKVLGLHPEEKANIAKLRSLITAEIQTISTLAAEQQKSELEKLAPELLEKKKEEKRVLPELPNAVQGKVVTRIPPEPSKYAHVGHALSFLINALYAEKYQGKCILKFEDTNPEKCTKEYVDAMLEDVTGYLGIRPDKVVLVSDELPRMYQEAEKLIKDGKAYVCLCERQSMQDLRHRGKQCAHRRHGIKRNLQLWEEMLAGKHAVGSAVLRLAGEMAAENQVMRDPVLFRISDAEHFKHAQFRVWPLYDFENAVSDCILGVTHILRSNEFGTMRTELQSLLKQLLGFQDQSVTQYGRFNITGALTKGREIREAIERGEFIGWDDPRLVTLKALKRRGILPETFRELVQEVGMTQNETNIDFSVLAAINRRLLDKRANRYFFIAQPEKVHITAAPGRRVELRLHPEDERRGHRVLIAKQDFLLEKKDVAFEKGKLYRLMDCLNFTKEHDHLAFHSEDYELYRKDGERIMHWLPADAAVDITVVMPDAVIKGKGEPLLAKVKPGDIVQFERFGFVRCDSPGEFWFSHR